jgi:hypothetical protein
VVTGLVLWSDIFLIAEDHLKGQGVKAALALPFTHIPPLTHTLSLKKRKKQELELKK